MLRKNILFSTALYLLSLHLGAQNTIKHVVKKGENVYQLLKKYKINSAIIFKYNPGSQTVIRIGETLNIPTELDENITIKPEIENGYLIHWVTFGETKFGLAKKYTVTIPVMEELNPQIVPALLVGHRLRFPTMDSQNENVNSSSSMLTQKPDESNKKNENSKKQGLKSNDIAQNDKKTLIPNFQEAPKLYTVKKGDTKFSLAKKFGFTIAELEQLNPNTVPVLMVGDKIKTKKTENESKTITNEISSKTQEKKAIEKPAEKTVAKPTEKKSSEVKLSKSIEDNKSGKTKNQITEKLVSTPVENNSPANYTDYTIKPKETLYGLSKKAGISIADLTKINPELNKGVIVGMIIKMPKNETSSTEIPINAVSNNTVESKNTKETTIVAKTTVEKPSVEINNTKETNTAVTNSPAEKLTESILKNNLLSSAVKSIEKKLYIVSPFSQTELDQLIKNSSNLDPKTKSQIDFLKGSQLAVENVKKQGFKLNVEWITSKDLEKQKTLQEKIKKENSGILWTSDKNTDINLIETYASENTPVIFTNPEWNHLKNNNIYQALPNTESERIKVLEYLKSQNGQIIVIQDRKNTELINRYFPEAKFIMPNNKGYLDTNILKQSLSATQPNFVILDTAKNGLVITSTTTLLAVANQFKIQLAILESAKIPNNGKVSQNRFKILKMIYPTTQIATSGTLNFSENPVFQNIEKPDQNLLKGYDVTTDTALRLFQEKSFKEMAEKTDSEQLITRFDYQKNDSGSYFNGGINLMQLDTNGTAQVIKP